MEMSGFGKGGHTRWEDGADETVAWGNSRSPVVVAHQLYSMADAPHVGLGRVREASNRNVLGEDPALLIERRAAGDRLRLFKGGTLVYTSKAARSGSLPSFCKGPLRAG